MGVEIDVVRGDITGIDVEAIVNPANSQMIMGGGVAGAIKRAGGRGIEEEAKKYAPVPVGRAVATGGGRLKAKYVIHAPTMEQPAMRTTPSKVRAAVKASLNLCRKLGIREVAFPGMGTGVGGLDVRVAAELMINEIVEHVKEGTTLTKILLVAYNEKLYKAFKEELEKLLGSKKLQPS